MKTEVIHYSQQVSFKPDVERLAPLKANFVWNRFKTNAFIGLLLVAITLILFVLIILKSLSVVRFNEIPVLYSYAILLMVFQMSRIISALLYRSHIPRHAKSQTKENLYHPSVTFIIPCMNEEAVIYENIKHCFDAEYPSKKIEVIIINDGSTDNTMQEIMRAKKDFKSFLA